MVDEQLQTHTTALQIRGSLGLMTEEDLAAVLKLNSVSTLATWRSQRKGPPYVKLGKKVFYTVRDLGEWIVGEGQRQNTPTNDNQPADQKAAA